MLIDPNIHVEIYVEDLMEYDQVPTSNYCNA